MSLQFVTGGSGVGKSTVVYRELIEQSMKHPEQNFIVIVPEQFTMQTQSALVQMHPRKGTLNIDVLSFNRLAYRVFEEVGGNTEPILEEIGKTLVLRRILAKHKSELTLLGTDRQGTVAQVKSLISELLQYRISPEDTAQWEAQFGGLLSRKLSDVKRIYEAFLSDLENRFLTTEEVPERLCTVIGQSELIQGSTVVMDGFTGFTPVQMKVVSELLHLCAEVTVIVTGDKDLLRPCSPQFLFQMSHKMAADVTKASTEAGCEILPIREVKGPGRFAKNPELQFLEKALFRYHAGNYTKEMNSVHLFEAADPKEEIATVTSELCRRIRTEGLRCRDFAIVTADLDTYGRKAADALQAEGIPYFLDQKRSLMQNPFAAFLCSAVEMLRNSFSYDSVFRFLRSGLTEFTQEETDKMENYVRAVGIRGWKQYSNEWTRQSRLIQSDQLPELNQLREKFHHSLEAFVTAFRKRGTVRDKTEALYGLVFANQIQEQLQKYADHFASRGDAAHAKEFSQAYGIVMNLFDKMVEILGDEPIGMRLYSQILEAGLSECSIGLIPPGEDQVLIGDIERTRLSGIRVLFFVGVNDGCVPKLTQKSGVLTSSDRAQLQNAGVELSPDLKEELYRQRFYLYLALTKPDQYLYVSWSRTDAKGEAKSPSYLIAAVQKLFPGLGVENTEELSISRRLETNAGREQYLMNYFDVSASEESKDSIEDLLNSELISDEILKRMECAAMMHDMSSALSSDTAKALYGKNLVLSATRLEQFAGCAFQHFVKHGLKLKEREVYEFNSADFGTIIHAAIEFVSNEILESGRNWRELEPSQRDALADQSLTEIVHEYGNTILDSSNRNRASILRIGRILKRTLWALQEQLRMGDFEPAGAEVKFKNAQTESYQLDDGGSLRLTGKIDRIDLCKDKDREYLRVIDYKTGEKRFDLNQLYYGLQLQLILYINRIREQLQKMPGHKKVSPAGFYYYKVQDPFLSDSDRKIHPNNVEEKMLKELRLQGLSINDPDVLEHSDQAFAEDKKASKVLRVRFKKDGSPHSDAQVVSEQEFDIICAFADQKIRNLGNAVLQGEIGASPLQNKDWSACKYCPYRAVCRFDERIPGYQARQIQKKEADEVLEQMAKELGYDAAGGAAQKAIDEMPRSETAGGAKGEGK